MLSLFPFAMLTWRESVIGVQPVEMTYMQVQHDWVSASMPGYHGYGAGYAMGENLGSIKWRMSEDYSGPKVLRTLRSEAYERTTESRQVEEITVEARSNRIVRQVEQRFGVNGTSQSVCTFLSDHVENRRTGPDGRTVTVDMYPGDGMEAVQRRFEPLGNGPKEFLVVDGLKGTFNKMRVELAGRFQGSWGMDRFKGNAYRFTYGGKEQTVMLTPQGEIVKVEFAREYSLTPMAQLPSRRKSG